MLVEKGQAVEIFLQDGPDFDGVPLDPFGSYVVDKLLGLVHHFLDIKLFVKTQGSYLYPGRDQPAHYGIAQDNFGVVLDMDRAGGGMHQVEKIGSLNLTVALSEPAPPL